VTVATLTPVPVVGRQVAAVPVIPTSEPAATPDQSSTLILVPVTSTPQPERTTTQERTATPAASPTVTFTPSPSPTPGPPTLTPTPSATPDPSQLSSVENSLINAHNDARQAQGLGALTMHPTLMSIARTRAQHMALVNSMTHYGPSGATVFTLMTQQGYAYVDGAENIHFNSGFSEAQSWQTAMSEYLASPSHRTAIMKPHFRRIGVAVATSASGVRYYSVVLSD